MKNNCIYTLMRSSFVASLLALGVTSLALADGDENVQIRIIGITDLQEQLELSTILGGNAVGGLEYLTTHIKQEKANNPNNTVVVHTGDMIGAGPFMPQAFNHEPTVQSLNLMGLDIHSIGNLDLNEGVAELKRLEKGGCDPVDGCQSGEEFEGSNFNYLSANAVIKGLKGKNEKLKEPWKPYIIKTFQGVKVAFIGITPLNTPSIANGNAFPELTFIDEAEAVNKLITELKKKQADVIVVLLHESAGQSTPSASTNINACSALTFYRLGDIMSRFDDRVDVVMNGNGGPYICNPGDRPDDFRNILVTQPVTTGRGYVVVDLVVEKKTGKVISKTAINKLNTRNVAPDPDQTALLQKYNTLVAPIANQPVGTITADIRRFTNYVDFPSGEAPLGNIVADAMLEAAKRPPFNAVAALTNVGGIRVDLLFNSSSAGEGDGVVTRSEAFNVLPFGNLLLTMDLTGAQLKTLLEQQFNNPASAGQLNRRTLQVSNGFTYDYDTTNALGSKVSNIKINGVLVEDTTTYRVAFNDFLAQGGDNYSVLLQGTNRATGPELLTLFYQYLLEKSPIAPPALDRINRLD